MRNFWIVMGFLCSASASRAALIIGSDFEGPAPGTNLEASMATLGTQAERPWLAFHNSSIPSYFNQAVYSSERAFEGQQSIKITRGPTNNVYSWFYAEVPQATFDRHAPVIVTSARFFVEDGASNGAFFGLEHIGTGVSLGRFGLVGDGTIIGQAINPVTFGVSQYRATTSTGSYLTYHKGEWNLLEAFSYFNADETQVTTYYAVNGNILRFGPTGSNLLGLTTYGSAADLHFSDGDIFTGAVGASSGSKVCFVDNFRVNSAVPEPTSLMGLGFVFGCFALHKRRK